MDAKRLPDARSKPVCLHQQRHETLHFFKIGPMRQIPEGFLPLHAGSQFQRQDVQFIPQGRMRCLTSSPTRAMA